MALKDKAAKIDLSQIGASPGSRGQGSKTAIGMHADALFRDERVTAENVELKKKLAQFDGANATRKINPNAIKPSKWANRHELSYDGEAFKLLRKEIESAGGNVQPIKVRPSMVEGEFELVFGHRRHRACQELGLDVLAVIEAIDDDKELFRQMDIENRARANLSPWEVGTTYAKALDNGLFPSVRKLAEAVAVDVGNMSKALALARLPAEVIAAFPSPLDLQYRWATLLSQALQKDPDVILARAKELRESQEKLNSPEVLTRLLEGCCTVQHPRAMKKVSIKGRDHQAAEIRLDGAKKTVTINLSNIDMKRFPDVEKAIKELLA